MAGDAIKQLFIENHSKRAASMVLVINQSLKLFEKLEGSFEANGSRLDVMLARRLSHNRANEIVGQDVRPDFFAHQFRRLATQNVHLQSLFHRAQIKLDIPTCPIECPNVLFGKLLGHRVALLRQ